MFPFSLSSKLPYLYLDVLSFPSVCPAVPAWAGEARSHQPGGEQGEQSLSKVKHFLSLKYPAFLCYSFYCRIDIAQLLNCVIKVMKL